MLKRGNERIRHEQERWNYRKKYAEKNQEVKKSARRDQRNLIVNLPYQAEEAASK
jgi:hypothetical protein